MLPMAIKNTKITCQVALPSEASDASLHGDLLFLRRQVRNQGPIGSLQDVDGHIHHPVHGYCESNPEKIGEGGEKDHTSPLALSMAVDAHKRHRTCSKCYISSSGNAAIVSRALSSGVGEHVIRRREPPTGSQRQGAKAQRYIYTYIYMHLTMKQKTVRHTHRIS